MYVKLHVRTKYSNDTSMVHHMHKYYNIICGAINIFFILLKNLQVTSMHKWIVFESLSNVHNMNERCMHMYVCHVCHVCMYDV